MYLSMGTYTAVAALLTVTHVVTGGEPPKHGRETNEVATGGNNNMLNLVMPGAL